MNIALFNDWTSGDRIIHKFDSSSSERQQWNSTAISNRKSYIHQWNWSVGPVSNGLTTAVANLHCVSKMSTFYDWINLVKNQSVLIMFGALSPMHLKNVTTLLWEIFINKSSWAFAPATEEVLDSMKLGLFVHWWQTVHCGSSANLQIYPVYDNTSYWQSRHMMC